MKRVLSCVSILAILAGCATGGTGSLSHGESGGHYRTDLYRTDLTDDIVQSVATGDSLEAVRAKLGAPHQRVRFDNLGATAWDYLYRDTWGYWVELAIMIGDDGRVRNKVARRIDSGRNDR